jgi:polyhydroxyalkanoate synthase subunit PhaC
MSAVDRIARAPAAAVELANTILTTPDATIGATPKEVVWTHRTTTLYRYHSERRVHAVPILLVFALINRPDVFDLRPGHSFVEYLLDEGFDVFLLDWGVPDDEDGDRGLESYVCDELHWGVRETLRAADTDAISLLGWCIGGTLCVAYAALHPRGAVRNLVLLTTPIDAGGARYTRWVGRDSFDVDQIADTFPAVPGRSIDWANRLLKPVTNFWTTYRRLAQQTIDGEADREAYQSMAKWVADNPPFPGRAYREWITWIYKENRLVRGRLELRGERVDLRAIEANLLVVTAGSDHITPRDNTTPLLELVASADVTHIARAGGHIGLMAGSKARNQIWPDVAAWLGERAQA